MAKEKKLEVKNLVISFRTTDGKLQAVRNISFDLYKGETLAIVGESGSGKSVTSKAIIGISAGNAIIEGGDILYDGQDLLRISEEDFHKIRGDKIAMIFQDPLSSLNPIIKIGVQLTEAMILKNKAARRNCRKDFNTMLATLLQNVNEVEANGDEKSPISVANKALCDEFNKFNVKSLELEEPYATAVRTGEEILPNIENLILNIEKDQKIKYDVKVKEVALPAKKLAHHFYVAKEKVLPLCDQLLALAKVAKTEPSNEIAQLLKELKTLIFEAKQFVVPNYFAIGYYVTAHPETVIENYAVEDLNKISEKALQEDFMSTFIEKAIIAAKNSESKAFEGKKVVVEEFEKVLKELESTSELDKKRMAEFQKSLNDLVDNSIDKLAVAKDNLAYTFKYSFKSAIEKYFNGVANNPKELKRHEKEQKRYDRLVARGKTPEWKVTPAAVIDLESTKAAICKVLERIIRKYKAAILSENATDYNLQAEKLVEYFKEKARGVADVVTPALARAKALKLMEEVGIPEPAIRYNQYPFEFSGGMRQRIVIAIALAANPDILICDEPTTALDVTIQAQILELINKIKKERNLSIIFITHDLGVVANMADRIAVMYAGKIVECGTDQDIFYDPRHPYTWALLASMPDLETKEKLEAIPGTPPNMIYPPKGDAFAARNKYALEIDFEEQPPLFKISDTHQAATWLLHPDAPKVDPPKIVTERIARIREMGGKE